MQRPIRLALVVFVALAIAVAIFVTVQVTAKPVAIAVIDRIGYVQNQAVPGFTDTQHTVTDANRIAAFEALTEKYGIDLAHFNTAQNDVCTGGLGTTITINFRPAEDSTRPADTLLIYSCNGTKAKNTFVTDATHLFSTWRAEDR